MGIVAPAAAWELEAYTVGASRMTGPNFPPGFSAPLLPPLLAEKDAKSPARLFVVLKLVAPAPPGRAKTLPLPRALLPEEAGTGASSTVIPAMSGLPRWVMGEEEAFTEFLRIASSGSSADE